MNNENLTEEQIQVELRQLEQREGLKELDADVVNKTEQWHTFMLEAKEGKTRKTKQIRRKPTKATNEDEVSEADRKLHQRIADEVKRKLQAKGESTEGVENFEAFYEMLKGEALKLQQEYQPQLRNGIKIAVDLVNSVQKDKQDGDVDIRVKIAPNNTEVLFGLEGPKEARFSNLAHQALQVVAKKHVDSEIDNREDIREITEGQKIDDIDENDIGSKEGQNVDIDQEADSLHRKLMKTVKAYQTACKAQLYPSNTFSVGRGRFFVGTKNNYYLYAHNEVERITYDYYLESEGGKWLSAIFNSQNEKSKKQIEDAKNAVISTGGRIQTWQNELEGLESIPEKDREDKKIANLKARIESNTAKITTLEDKRDILLEDSTIKDLDGLSTDSSFDMNLPNRRLAFFKRFMNEEEEVLKRGTLMMKPKFDIFSSYSGAKTKIIVNEQKSDGHDYGTNPLSLKNAKFYMENYPTNIDSSGEAATFMASLTGEPNRYSVAHITNLLLLGEKSELNQDSTPAPKVTNDSTTVKTLDTSDKVRRSDNMYNHQSMTMAGSQPGSEKSNAYPKDERINMIDDKHKPNQNVTNRDLNTLHQNSVLKAQMLDKYQTLETSSDQNIISEFVELIEVHLNLNHDS